MLRLNDESLDELFNSCTKIVRCYIQNMNQPNAYENGKIYCLENSENDMKYVGSTCKTLKTRFIQHVAASKTMNAAIYQAMREIGSDKFSIRHLSDVRCSNRSELVAEENCWVRHLKTLSPHGYNTTVPGRSQAVYLVENRVELSRKARLKYLENRDDQRLRTAAYILAHKEEIEAKDNARNFLCECGKPVSYHNRVQHQRTKIHRIWNEAKKEQIIQDAFASLPHDLD